MPTRRRFIQVGLAGAALLAVGGMLQRTRPLPAYRVLDAGAATLIGALVPVVLAGALPSAAAPREAAIRETVEGFDRAVAGLAPAVRDEIERLLGLFRFAPTRWALTGVGAPFEEASPAEIAGFLARWRASRLGPLRAGYQALTQLIQAAWYGNSASWRDIGYPGPPAISP